MGKNLRALRTLRVSAGPLPRSRHFLRCSISRSHGL